MVGHPFSSWMCFRDSWWGMAPSWWLLRVPCRWPFGLRRGWLMASSSTRSLALRYVLSSCELTHLWLLALLEKLLLSWLLLTLLPGEVFLTRNLLDLLGVKSWNVDLERCGDNVAGVDSAERNTVDLEWTSNEEDTLGKALQENDTLATETASKENKDGTGSKGFARSRGSDRFADLKWKVSPIFLQRCWQRLLKMCSCGSQVLEKANTIANSSFLHPQAFHKRQLSNFEYRITNSLLDNLILCWVPPWELISLVKHSGFYSTHFFAFTLWWGTSLVDLPKVFFWPAGLVASRVADIVIFGDRLMSWIGVPVDSRFDISELCVARVYWD